MSGDLVESICEDIPFVLNVSTIFAVNNDKFDIVLKALASHKPDQLLLIWSFNQSCKKKIYCHFLSTLIYGSDFSTSTKSS